MPLRIEWEDRGVVRRFHGSVTDAEARTAMEEVHADPRFDDMHYIIDDLSAVTSFSVSTDELAMIEAMDRASLRSNGHILRACVLDAARAGGIAGALQRAPVHGYDTVFFETLADARAWLDQVLNPRMSPVAARPRCRPA